MLMLRIPGYSAFCRIFSETNCAGQVEKDIHIFFFFWLSYVDINIPLSKGEEKIQNSSLKTAAGQVCSLFLLMLTQQRGKRDCSTCYRLN
jgi:hypothetical protein